MFMDLWTCQKRGLDQLSESKEIKAPNTVLVFWAEAGKGIFYKGSSSNKLLYALVLCLHLLEVKHTCIVHLIYCAGTHMIAQGTDVVSRGNTNEEIMREEEMLSFVTLHLTAWQASPTLETWIRSWAPQEI
eukprot:2537727-Ditylum_brightwellii.AAC.1